jgi:carboxypeptidase family protein
MKRILLLFLPILILAACSSGAATPAPSGSAALAPRQVTSVEDAAARVIEAYPSLAGVGPKDPNVIGACCWWTGSESSDGYTVMFQVGWGDCPAGCIDNHTWTFTVSKDGAVELTAASGPPVPPGSPGAGIGSSCGGGILPGGSGIQGHVMAGPTCPVQKPNDPACADRPMAGVTIVVLTAAGNEAARTTTDASGYYAVTLPAGPYTIEPQPVEGMVRGSPTVAVTVGDGVTTVDIPYDTGIR